MEELLERIISLEKRVEELEKPIYHLKDLDETESTNNEVNEEVNVENVVTEEREQITDEDKEQITQEDREQITEEDKEQIKALIQMYIKDILKSTDKKIIKELTKEISDWREIVENYLGLTKYKIKKIVTENKDKDELEILVILLPN
jgi:hypothetical protein